jgi:hypothetical protein
MNQSFSLEIAELANRMCRDGQNKFAAAICFLGSIFVCDNPELQREVVRYLEAMSTRAKDEDEDGQWPSVIGVEKLPEPPA